jgi:peptide/nickel transport system permease protein
MWNYILRRIILLPITLFFIVLVNFFIINLAPGDPSTFVEVSASGSATMRADRSVAFSGDERYLHFREFYGLTLPIILNTWPWIKLEKVENNLRILANHKTNSNSQDVIPTKDYNDLRIKFGDQSRFIMPHLLEIIENPQNSTSIRLLATHFFIRGGSRENFIGPHLSAEQEAWNSKVSKDDQVLRSFAWKGDDPEGVKQKKIDEMRAWYNANTDFYHFNPQGLERVKILFFETRFTRYMSRVIHLDFGTLRNDANKTVLSEVFKRFKYSLTLALFPMLLTFIFCQIFGFIMAFKQKQLADYALNILFLILYAIPIFVVAPFLIEEIALHHTFPFTTIPIPISGFTSPDDVYEQLTSGQRLFNVLQHIALPMIAIMYGTLAAQSRISRTAVLEVLRQDYVRTAWAKGVPPLTILFKHVGRNAAITIVTSIAGSLGIVLGGSLIVETLFDINGFGKFFYDAVINRDYNVIMFSALAGSFLTLLGYLFADLAYMWLDPRITLD